MICENRTSHEVILSGGISQHVIRRLELLASRAKASNITERQREEARVLWDAEFFGVARTAGLAGLKQLQLLTAPSNKARRHVDKRIHQETSAVRSNHLNHLPAPAILVNAERFA